MYGRLIKKEDMQYFWDKVDFITTDEPLGLLKDIMKVKIDIFSEIMYSPTDYL